MSATTEATPRQVSRNCADGKHERCLGTVYVQPPVKGSPRLVACDCPVENCGHGSETTKARRRA